MRQCERATKNDKQAAFPLPLSLSSRRVSLRGTGACDFRGGGGRATTGGGSAQLARRHGAPRRQRVMVIAVAMMMTPRAATLHRATVVGVGHVLAAPQLMRDRVTERPRTAFPVAPDLAVLKQTGQGAGGRPLRYEYLCTTFARFRARLTFALTTRVIMRGNTSFAIIKRVDAFVP